MPQKDDEYFSAMSEASKRGVECHHELDFTRAHCMHRGKAKFSPLTFKPGESDLVDDGAKLLLS